MILIEFEEIGKIYRFKATGLKDDTQNEMVKNLSSFIHTVTLDICRGLLFRSSFSSFESDGTTIECTFFADGNEDFLFKHSKELYFFLKKEMKKISYARPDILVVEEGEDE